MQAAEQDRLSSSVCEQVPVGGSANLDDRSRWANAVAARCTAEVLVLCIASAAHLTALCSALVLETLALARPKPSSPQLCTAGQLAYQQTR